jgi:CO/xanthine dehydrogenase FAD-binding subunit
MILAPVSEVPMSIFQEYYQPQTVSDAVDKLAGAAGSAAVIAGGTDLLLDIRQGRHDPVDVMIDVSGIPEMSQIRMEGDQVYLGAAVTHKQIITSPILKEHAQCVVEGCGLIGGPQVRNVATIGGNVAHALPAGDGIISLLALDTEVALTSPDGTSWLPLAEIFAGPGKVTFDRSRVLVTGFRFPVRGVGEGSAFTRVMRPQGVAIAILNMSAWVRLRCDGGLEQVRIACGPAGPKPFRAVKTEEFLSGKSLDPEVMTDAANLLDGEVSLRTSKHRATEQYRHQLLPLLLKEVLDSAVQRAGNYQVEKGD